MTTYRCRFVKPKESQWATVEADSEVDAAQEFHDRYDGGFSQIERYSAVYYYDPNKPAAKIHFACIEIDGHGERVSRIFHSGIARRGRRFGMSIQDIAKAIGWQRDPAELLESGWEGEEDKWT